MLLSIDESAKHYQLHLALTMLCVRIHSMKLQALFQVRVLTPKLTEVMLMSSLCVQVLLTLPAYKTPSANWSSTKRRQPRPIAAPISRYIMGMRAL